MDNLKILEQRYVTIAWGAFFIVLGVVWIVPGLLLDYALGMLGVGIILLALNLARYLSHIPMKAFTIVLGVLALIEGAVTLLRLQLGIRVSFPFFSILLIVIGLILLIQAVTRAKNDQASTQLP